MSKSQAFLLSVSTTVKEPKQDKVKGAHPILHVFTC